MTKNILFLSFYFPPYCNTPSIRAMEITKRVKNFGYNFFVACVKPIRAMPKDNELINHINYPEIKINKTIHFTIPFSYIEKLLRRISRNLDFFEPSFIFNWIPISFMEM